MEIQVGNDKIYARIENHETVVTDVDYKMGTAKKLSEDWDHEETVDVEIKECKNKLEWIRMLVYYCYSPTTKEIDSFSSVAIGKVNFIPMFSNYIHALFPGSDGSVFWFSGDDKDELNIHKPDKGEPESHKIDKKSLLFQFLDEGNSYSESGRSVPVQMPVMKVFGHNRVIIFSRFVFGEVPSVCFYSIE